MYYHEARLQQYAIAEGSRFSWAPKEEELVSWWLGQSEFMNSLQTVDGEQLIILDSGLRNDGPGPDIFGARIILDDFEMSGDVEMHLRAKDWYAHHHENDEDYNGVILHVIMGGDKGPDIPTLVVDSQWLGAGSCLARRYITTDELIWGAYGRFLRKQSHLRQLVLENDEYHPLQLGMIEIIMSGKSRSKLLHQSALALGLKSWPDCKAWEGSNQSYYRQAGRGRLFEAVIQNPHIFKSNNWFSASHHSWELCSNLLIEMQAMGLSQNQVREWLVNVLAPYRGENWGFALWLSTKIFRHYGIEKRLLPRIGLKKIGTIAEQQGLLAWNTQYCQKSSCLNCPLVQSHHTLTHFN